MWSARLKRFFNIDRDKVNDGPEPAENPEEMLRLATLELEQVISRVSKALAVAAAHQVKLEKAHEQLKSESQEWYRKAALALKAGQEAQAQKALAQKALTDKKETAYQALVDNSAQALGQLQQQLDEYTIQLEKIKTKQTIGLVRTESAKARKQLGKSMAGLDGSILTNLTNYENTYYQLEAEAESLALANGLPTQFDHEFGELENKLSARQDLEQLRAEIEQKNQTQEQQKMAAIRQQFDALAKETNTHSIKISTSSPATSKKPEQDSQLPVKEEDKLAHIQQLFEVLNNSAHTRQLKSPPSAKDDLTQRMDDFFKKE